MRQRLVHQAQSSTAWLQQGRASPTQPVGQRQEPTTSVCTRVGQVSQEQEKLSRRRLVSTRARRTFPFRLRIVGWEGAEMSASDAGAGPLMEPEDPDRPRPAPVVGEHAILTRIRNHVTLKALTLAANRDRKLINELAVITNAIRMQIADVLHSFLQGRPATGAHARHRDIITAIAIIYDLCDDISV